ncbi:hypothetical protein DFJ67_5614 [Asanoa ferruginea]|uniref:Uncharacterized protein n=1 Tax=Asanoa ferruginea TaxID=53367 RepID=A0A3D9ZQS1_9ACTN|nr:hypothetical protein [Asanoa ferruginea]REF99575.1 hypothetical protein DFJ67_5614 [Asanoa ferruginea]GIF52281.1 hypothetical protein Afe04nite_68200 [Asanoa ferruginea]
MSSLTRCPVLVIEPGTALAPALCDLLGVPVCAVWHGWGADVVGEIRRRQPLVVVIRPWPGFGHPQLVRLRALVDLPVVEVATGTTMDVDPEMPHPPFSAADVAEVVRRHLTAAERRELVGR